jgi:type IV secretory pathway TrbD component
VAGHADVAPFTAPGLAVAERMGARLARDTLGSGLSRALAIGSGIAGVLGLGLTLAGWIAPGFGFAVLAALLLAMEAVVRRVSTAGQVRPRVSLLVQALTVLLDPILVLMVAVASPEDTQWLRLFVPAVLIGLLHLGERLAVPRWRRSYQDRVLLSVLFVPAALFGVIQPFVAFIALVVMITLFLTSQPRD